MKFSSTNRTVLVKKSEITFDLAYRVTAADHSSPSRTARLYIAIECEQGFGKSPKFSGTIALFANHQASWGSEDYWFHYTLSANAAEHLSDAVSLQRSAEFIAYLLVRHSDAIVGRDTGDPIGERISPIEDGVWAALRAKASHAVAWGDAEASKSPA